MRIPFYNSNNLLWYLDKAYVSFWILSHTVKITKISSLDNRWRSVQVTERRIRAVWRQVQLLRAATNFTLFFNTGDDCDRCNGHTSLRNTVWTKGVFPKLQISCFCQQDVNVNKSSHLVPNQTGKYISPKIRNVFWWQQGST